MSPLCKVHKWAQKKCSICGKVFQADSVFERHLLVHSHVRSFSCSLCPATFKEKKKLRRHENNVHRKKQVTCPKCLKSYSSVENLKHHLYIVHGDTYKCPLCPGNEVKVFHSKAALKKHIHFKHKNQGKTYDCLFCPKSYSRPDCLSKHMTSRHGSKEVHRCTECDKTYPSADSLKLHKCYKHRKIGGRIACPICKKHILCGEIRRHIKVVHGPPVYTCDVCQHVCKSASGLRIHKEHQHINPLQQHTCQICYKTYKYESDLKFHMKKKNHLILPECFVKLVRCKTEEC